MRDAVIVGSLRTAVGKAPRGALKDTRPDDMAGTVIRAVLEATPGLEPSAVEDVILGCAMPEAEQGMNVARQASWLAGIPEGTSAVTINRFCSSGLQAIAFAAERVKCGWADCIIAGGTETMSMIPMGGHKIVPNPRLVDTWPDYYLNMGLTAENLARKYGISRSDADAFSLRSHQKAVEAIRAGKFKDEIVPLAVKTVERPRHFGKSGNLLKPTVLNRFDQDSADEAEVWDEYDADDDSNNHARRPYFSLLADKYVEQHGSGGADHCKNPGQAFFPPLISTCCVSLGGKEGKDGDWTALARARADRANYDVQRKKGILAYDPHVGNGDAGGQERTKCDRFEFYLYNWMLDAAIYRFEMTNASKLILVKSSSTTS